MVDFSATNKDETEREPISSDELKKAMADAHPDRGGTNEAFIRARARYLAAKSGKKFYRVKKSHRANNDKNDGTNKQEPKQEANNSKTGKQGEKKSTKKPHTFVYKKDIAIAAITIIGSLACILFITVDNADIMTGEDEPGNAHQQPQPTFDDRRVDVLQHSTWEAPWLNAFHRCDLVWAVKDTESGVEIDHSQPATTICSPTAFGERTPPPIEPPQADAITPSKFAERWAPALASTPKPISAIIDDRRGQQPMTAEVFRHMERYDPFGGYRDAAMQYIARELPNADGPVPCEALPGSLRPGAWRYGLCVDE
jgi:hypothetical protein